MAKLSLREGHKQLTRRRILDAAAVVFERDGFAALSVENIAAEAEVSRPTFYQYFRNKTDALSHLLAEQAEHGSLLFAARLSGNLQPTVSDVREWIEGFVDRYDENLDTLKAWAYAESDPASLDAIGLVQRRVTEVLSDWVAAVRAETGAPISDDEARVRGILLFAQIDRFCYYWRLRGWPADRGVAIDAMVEAWWAALYGSTSRAGRQQ